MQWKIGERSFYIQVWLVLFNIHDLRRAFCEWLPSIVRLISWICMHRTIQMSLPWTSVQVWRKSDSSCCKLYGSCQMFSGELQIVSCDCYGRTVAVILDVIAVISKIFEHVIWPWPYEDCPFWCNFERLLVSLKCAFPIWLLRSISDLQHSHQLHNICVCVRFATFKPHLVTIGPIVEN